MLKKDEKINLKAKTIAELKALVNEAEKQVVEARMALATNRGGNTRVGKMLRKKIAVLKTYINQKN